MLFTSLAGKNSNICFMKCLEQPDTALLNNEDQGRVVRHSKEKLALYVIIALSSLEWDTR